MNTLGQHQTALATFLAETEFRKEPIYLKRYHHLGHKFSVLGIATHLVNPDHPALYLRHPDDSFVTRQINAPDDVVEFFSLRDGAGSAWNRNTTSLQGLNNTKSFKQISKILFRYPERFFIHPV